MRRKNLNWNKFSTSSSSFFPYEEKKSIYKCHEQKLKRTVPVNYSIKTLFNEAKAAKKKKLIFIRFRGTFSEFIRCFSERNEKSRSILHFFSLTKDSNEEIESCCQLLLYCPSCSTSWQGFKSTSMKRKDSCKS